MTKKQDRKRTQLSKQQLKAYIRAASLDTQNITFTHHVMQQMRKRHISMACVLSTLREGRIKRTPEPNIMLGNLECRMEHYCTGQNVGVVVAISDDAPDLALVTAMYIFGDNFMYHYTDGGLRNVWLKNGYVEKDTPYGKAVSFHDLDGLMKAICIALANKSGKLTGAEFRYLRSGMLLSQKSLGKLLGCTEQAVAKWEKSGRIPKTSDFVVRMIYKQAHDGKEGIGATVEMLNTIDRVSHARIIVSEAHDKWTSKVEDQEAALA